jgi:hypothetical protein
MNSHWRDEKQEVDESPHGVLIQPPIDDVRGVRFRRRRPEQRDEVEEPKNGSLKRFELHISGRERNNTAEQ